MAEVTEEKKAETDSKRVHTYPLIRAMELPKLTDDKFTWKKKVQSELKKQQHSDMADEMKNEAMELCVTACEKYASNNESAAKMIKEAMDKKFGASWHAVIGEGYGFEITHEVKNLLYMFFGGNMAIILWKCS